MFTDETELHGPTSVTAAPSLATDLSWLLSVAARPSMQARYPKLAEMFDGREDLADRVKSFWDDGSDEICFTEVQALAHHAGALGQTRPGALWQAIEVGVATIPVDLEMASEGAEEQAVFRDRFRRLKESPQLVRSYVELLAGGLGPRRRHVATGAAGHRGGGAPRGGAVRSRSVIGDTSNAGV